MVQRIVFDSRDDLYLIGEFSDTVDFDPELTQYKLGAITPPQYESVDIFIQKLSKRIVSVNDNILSIHTNIIPNPSTGIFTIEPPFKNLHEKINISIYTFEGMLLKEYSLNSQPKLLIDLSDQPQGIYVIKLSSGTENFTSKVSLIR